MKTDFDMTTELLSTLRGLKEKLLTSDRQKKVFVSPFAGSSKSLFVKSISDEQKQILLLCPSVQSINETKVELSILGLAEQVIAADDLNIESLQEKLTDLNNRERFILISSYDILKLKLPSKDSVEKNTTKIAIGGSITYDDLVEYFHSIDYNREKFVEDPGDFSVRGSIIDFWSYSEKQPCRLEFDGDFLESIRHFDPDSQRSLDKINSSTVASSINISESSSDIFDYLDNPLVLASEYDLQNLSVEKNHETPDQFENDIDEELKGELYDADQEQERKEEKIERRKERKNEKENDGANQIEKIFEKNARWLIEDALGQPASPSRLAGYESKRAATQGGYDERIQLNLLDPPLINSNFELLSSILKDYSQKNFQVLIAVENELQSDRLRELLSDFKTEIAELIESGKIKFMVLAIKSGFISRNDKLILLTDYQIFNKPYRTKLVAKARFKKSRVKDFATIKRGDYVVHENFGIGQYVGLETIKIGDVEQESIKILYAEGGVVYVNLNYLSLVKKFSSKDNAQPRLSVLGSGEWKSTKKKVKSRIKEAARELITLYARRKSAQGFSFGPDSIWQKELEASFFYEDTPDQVKVSDEVKRDMESENPMDRLVCGDVGFGKTEIAVRAAFKAINDSKQAALLVPTTILAEQHYNTFKDRLSQFPVKVEVLSRFKTKSEQKEITERLTNGDVDLVIGTHRLLSKDIQFKDLGLLIIDEEHRFGVMAKEKLRSLKANVDTLTLTATPIPRTLNLSLLGARDLSIIATPPPNRQPIYTKVDTFDIHKVREWILSEIKRNGQIYFVHDRIQSIEKIAAYIQKYIPEMKIGVAHGQMKPAELEKVIHSFLNKNYHMLISTKIIESGLDIPNVNTIIINRADRFGLAELHQLRGRVGRSDRQAYAFFLVPSINTITKKAVKRLQAIEEYTELGEGFSLSMRDLEIRGAGNLLGTEQSGFIDSVGFEMYLKLLDEAVEELKQSEFKDVFKDLPKQQERSEPTIDTFFEIGIPQSYMPDQADRLSFYTALFSMLKIEELDEIKEEMLDRFGKIPPIVGRLIQAAVLRYYASLSLLERIIVQPKKIIIILPKGERENFYQTKFVLLLTYVNDNYAKEINFVQVKETLKLEMTNKYSSPEAAMNFLVKLCQEFIRVLS